MKLVYHGTNELEEIQASCLRMDEGGKGMEKILLDLDNSYLSTVKEAFNILILI